LVVKIHGLLGIVRQVLVEFFPRLNVGLDSLSDGISLGLDVGDHVTFVPLLTKQRRGSRQVYMVAFIRVPAPHGRGVDLVCVRICVWICVYMHMNHSHIHEKKENRPPRNGKREKEEEGMSSEGRKA